MTKTRVLISRKIWRFNVSFEWCKKDLWFGIYWENEHYDVYGVIDIYFGVPLFVLHFRYMHPKILEL